MALYKTEVIAATTKFKLSLCIKSRTAKRHYIISASSWWFSAANKVEIAKILDPHGNKTIKGGGRWKYYSKEEAEMLFTFATVKWS
jgi:hypothetical protein